MVNQQPCAVVFNPIKVSDSFRSVCEAALEAAGRTDIRWLETSKDDPGRGMTREAVELGADLVIAAGGDGTVRIVADGLAGTGIALGIVPEGTANLLALNLGIPNTEAAAVDTAINGRDRRIDLVKITVDDGASEHFAVMAGTGLDAMIMDETDDKLKATIGSAAYFLAVGKALGRLPMRAHVKIDDHHTRRRRAMLVLLGNVGRIPGIELIPGASADDGKLDVMIASPRRFRDWVKVALRLITRRPQTDDKIEIHQAQRVHVRLDKADTYQLDGDVAGEFTSLVAEIAPGALTVRVPH